MKLDSNEIVFDQAIRMKINDPDIRDIYTYLSNAGKTAYKDNYLLSNSIYAKSDLDRSLLDSYLTGKKIEHISILYKAKKILFYFAKSIGWLVVHWMQGCVHFMSRQKFIPNSSKPLTIIDIPMRMEKIIMNNNFIDHYFPCLEQRLQLRGMSYSYTPKVSLKNSPKLFFRAFRLIKNQNRPILFDFQLFGLIDYIKMFKFVLVYPFRVFRKIRKLTNSREDSLLRNFLWEAMDHATVRNYARQIFGKHISELNAPSIKCVSWYENQSSDKNFFKGLRSISKKTWIYGTQLFNWPSTLLNIHVDENEKKFNLVPDRVLVNGRYYLKNKSSIDFKVGPSMRYAKLFRSKVDVSNKKSILVLMPFFENEIGEIIELINKAKLATDVFVKFHPETDAEKYKNLLEKNMQLVDGSLYTLLSQVRCVIGKSNGALVEAASLGVPVINLEIGTGVGHNFFPDFGKGVLWENASSGEDIIRRINEFQELLLTDKEKILAMACKYREMLFCEPSDERIDLAFGLNDLDLPK
jgi:hypothetical protein